MFESVRVWNRHCVREARYGAWLDFFFESVRLGIPCASVSELPTGLTRLSPVRGFCAGIWLTGRLRNFLRSHVGLRQRHLFCVVNFH